MIKLELRPTKVAEWPAADRQLWEMARKPTGPFDDGGLAASWSASTIRHVEQGYGTYLAWSAKSGGLDAALSPIITQERLTAFLEAYAPGRAPLTVATTVRGIAYFYRAVSPPNGVVWLTKLGHHLTNTATPSRPKPPRMASIAELTELGQWLMAQGLEDLGDGKISGAQVYRDGLMIAALASRAMRRRNLCGLRFGHSFIKKAGSFRVWFSGKETKKGTHLDFSYPHWLIEPFEIYLRDVRPVLLKPHVKDEGWLWIGRRGRRLPANNVTTNITNLTKHYLDRSIPPHLFRDCTATYIAVNDPAHVGITKDILGHKTLASSQQYYNQATSVAALDQLSDVLSKIIES